MNGHEWTLATVCCEMCLFSFFLQNLLVGKGGIVAANFLTSDSEQQQKQQGRSQISI